MQHATRVIFPRGCCAVLAAACAATALLAKEPHSPDALAQRELEKRRATIEEAQELLTKGDQAYQAGRYADAVVAFSGAREVLPASPLTAELRAAAGQRYARASVELARSLSRKGDVAAAKAAVDAVIDSDIAPNDPAAMADASLWELRHRSFHHALVAGCGSPWLLRLHGQLVDQSERYRKIRILHHLESQAQVRDVNAEHQAVMDAVLRRDAAQAVALMTQHLVATSDATARLMAPQLPQETTR